MMLVFILIVEARVLRVRDALKDKVAGSARRVNELQRVGIGIEIAVPRHRTVKTPRGRVNRQESADFRLVLARS